MKFLNERIQKRITGWDGTWNDLLREAFYILLRMFWFESGLPYSSVIKFPSFQQGIILKVKLQFSHFFLKSISSLLV